MRNLKRVLSLALASVMLIGMMAIGAGAADYTDTNSISYKEAAEVMEAIGVMQGNDKNEFLPTAELTREAAAKIITYLLLGQKTADALTTGRAPYDDVAADRWSAGSIAYCQVNGIISGDGKGNFFPTQTVTGTQFAKMLLGAAGYDATVEGFTGSGYELNIAKMVVATRINKGIDSSLSATLTREEAAQMALNLLRTPCVEYTGGMDVTASDGTTIKVGGVRSNVTHLDTVNAAVVNSLFMHIFQTNLQYRTGVAGAYGRPSHSWTQGRTDIGTYPNTADLVYTASVKQADLKTDLSGYKRTYGVGNTLPTVTVNGQNVSIANTNDKTLADMTGAGRLVEYYANGNYEITNIVVVDPVLAQVSAINTSAKEVRIVNKSYAGNLPGDGSNNVVGGTTIVVRESDNKDMYDKLVEMKVDDYVLVTYNDGVVASVEVPETFVGTYTAKASSGKRTIGGTAYDDSYASKNFIPGAPTSLLDDQMTFGNDYMVYMDPYGNPLYASVDSISESKSAYVMDVDSEGSRVNNSVVYSARMLFTDGTQQWVRISSIDNNSASSNNSAFVSAYNTLQSTSNFVNFVVRADGSYALTNVAAGQINTYTNATITKNAVNFIASADQAGATSVMGNSRTVFLTGDGTYRSYTGIRNIPGWGSTNISVLTAKGTNVATMVIVHGTPVTVDRNYVYIVNARANSEYVDGATVYSYDAVVNGKVDVIKTTVTTDTAGAALRVGPYLIAQYSGDNISQLSATSAVPEHYVANEYIQARNSVAQITYSNSVLRTITPGSDPATDRPVIGGAPSSIMVTENFVVVGYDIANRASFEIPAGQIRYYSDIQNYTIFLNEDGMATTLVFNYNP